MRSPEPDWYRNGWSLDIKDMSWVEDTARQVDFLVKTLGLAGGERILDLACGYGRHSLEFAARGFAVTGVDITPEYIWDASETAAKRHLQVEFVRADIRDIDYKTEFDVVLSLADGAIGYLENEAENLKIFDKAAQALKPGGRHFMDLCSRTHAEAHFPKRHWEIGTRSVSLAEFSWDPATKRMLYGGWEIPFGKVATPPASVDAHSSTRLYDKEELRVLLAERGLMILETYGDYLGAPDSDKCLQLMVHAIKNGCPADKQRGSR